MNCCEPIRIYLSDRYECYARLWVPEPCHGAVLYLHGIQSHGGWFEESARQLAERGFMVLLPDRRGSGRNEQERGHAGSARLLLRDVSDYLDELHVRSGQQQIHLLGVSWGGKLAMAYMNHAAQRIASLTLVAPGLFPRVDLPFGQKVRVGVSVIASKRTLVDIPLNDATLFTANPERQAFIEQDERKLKKVSASFLMASRKLDHHAQAASNRVVDCPLRMMLAGLDRIIDNQKTKAFVRQCGWPHREITEYPDAHHTLEFERDPAPYFNDLADWIVEQNRDSASK